MWKYSHFFCLGANLGRVDKAENDAKIGFLALRCDRDRNLIITTVTQNLGNSHKEMMNRSLVDWVKIRHIGIVEFRNVEMTPVNLLPGAVSEILASVTDTGVLTVADRYGLMAATLEESLDEEESQAIDRLLRAVLKGRVKVVTDLSIRN